MAPSRKKVRADERRAFSDVSDRALAGNAPFLRNLTRRIGAALKREGLTGAVSAHVTVFVRQQGARGPQGASGINETLEF